MIIIEKSKKQNVMVLQVNELAGNRYHYLCVSTNISNKSVMICCVKIKLQTGRQLFFIACRRRNYVNYYETAKKV